MLVITNIEYIQTEMDPYTIERMLYDSHGGPMELATADGSAKFIDIQTTVDLVRGCHFNHYTLRRGHKSQLIGMTQAVQDVLGMQYEAVSTMNERAAEDAEREAQAIKNHKHLKNQMDNASLWNRIKWVFTGVMYEH